MADLYMMRHGQTLFNLHHMIQGWCDAPLTELGIGQARVAGEYFKNKGITFDHAYSSTAERACDTLELVCDMPYERVKGLKEMNFGKYEGQSEAMNPPLPYLDFFKKYAGGESQDEVQERMVKTVGEIMAREGHESVLIVTHGAALANFARYYDDKAAEGAHYRTGIKNCAIFHFEYEGGEFRCLEIIEHDFSELLSSHS